jgi:hypothetical protein
MALLHRRGSEGEAQPVEAYQAPAPAPAEPAPVSEPVPEPIEPQGGAESSSRFQLVEGAEEMLDMPLGTLIFRAGLIAPQQLEDALAEGLRTGKRLGEVLLARGWLSEEDLTRLLAGQKGLPFASPADVVIDQELASRLSYDDARREMALPLTVEFGVPVVAMADPNEDAMERIRLLMGEDVRFVVSAPSALAQSIDQVLGGVPSGLTVAPLEQQVPAASEPAPLPVSDDGIVPLAALDREQQAALATDEPALAGIGPQSFEQTASLAGMEEIDYPDFGQYETLPEAEVLSGPNEMLPPELQGEAPMDYSEQLYAEAGATPPLEPAGQPGAELADDAEPSSEPEPEAAHASDWPGNDALEQPYEPSEPEAAAAERAPEPAAEEPLPDQPPATTPAWALGEVSTSISELFGSAGETSEEETAMDEPRAEDVEPQTLAETSAPEPVEPEPVEVPASAAPQPGPPAVELQPVAGPESETVLEPALADPGLEPEPEATGLAEPEPAAEPVPAAEPEQPPAETAEPDVAAEGEAVAVAYFEVVLRLADGERLSIDSLPTNEAAQAKAQEIIMQVAASEPGKWPFIGGRFLRPDTILSVDIDSHAGWGGSGNRSRMFQGSDE